MKEKEGFALRLTEKMTERGVSQADLCRLAGLASSMVSHYCTGQRRPNLENVQKIADALGTTIDYFVDSSAQQPETAKSALSAIADGAQPNDPHLPPYNQTSKTQLLDYMLNTLNTEGQDKLFAYAEDLISTGKYNKEE